MNPEFYDYLMERLFEIGVYDVYYTPIQMKKNRPAIKFSVLTGEELLERVVDIILNESSSLGVRVFDDIQRYCLKREIKKVNTPWGEVNVKLAIKEGKIVNVAPEYEDCKMIAKENNVKIKKVYKYVENEISF